MTYVEYGFADPETKTIAVDEPLLLLAATYWINANHRTSYKFFAKQIHLHDSASNGFENYIAFCVDMLFSSQRRRINEVFSFVGTPPPLGSVCRFAFSGPPLALGMSAKTPEETTTCLNQRSHSPFCFPVDSMGPDLFLCSDLRTGRLSGLCFRQSFH